MPRRASIQQPLASKALIGMSVSMVNRLHHSAGRPFSSGASPGKTYISCADKRLRLGSAIILSRLQSVGAVRAVQPEGTLADWDHDAPRQRSGAHPMSSNIHWFGHSGVSLQILLGSLAILIASAVVIIAARRTAEKLLQRVHLPPETVLTVARVISAVLWVVVALILLSFWGISVSGLWASLVSVAAVIGVGFLAVWTMISNITASLFITMWRPFRLGDNVELLPDNLKGRAIDRNLMFTVLREDHGRALMVPNNLFFQRMFRVTTGDSQYLFETLERHENSREHREPATGDVGNSLGSSVGR
jgi:Mechanosensitive ion channel, beta-domain